MALPPLQITKNYSVRLDRSLQVFAPHFERHVSIAPEIYENSPYEFSDDGIDYTLMFKEYVQKGHSAPLPEGIVGGSGWTAIFTLSSSEEVRDIPITG